MAKIADFAALLESPKLISRKVWVNENPFIYFLGIFWVQKSNKIMKSQKNSDFWYYSSSCVPSQRWCCFARLSEAIFCCVVLRCLKVISHALIWAFVYYTSILLCDQQLFSHFCWALRIILVLYAICEYTQTLIISDTAEFLHNPLN